MVRAFFLAAGVFSALAANAQSAWKGTNPHSRVAATGDVRASAGAALTLASVQTGDEGFSGAITSLEAAPYRGRDVVLAGILQVEEGAGAGALWIRVDGDGQRLGFESTGRQPVHQPMGAQPREARLYVPVEATHLRFGITLGGIGTLRADSLTLSDGPARTGGVSAYDVVDAAIAILRAEALNRRRVDWEAERMALLTPELKELPAHAAYARIRTALAMLGDRHSTLQVPEQAARYRSHAVPTHPLESSASGGIGYLRMPGLMGSDSDAGGAFSASVCARIEAMADTSASGLIVDLRSNSGGNMWPMVNGLHPLLGSGEIGAFRDAAGNITPWTARAVPGCSAEMASRRVAVLVGERTASSGEAVAIAFKGRANTRFFGRRTSGLATANVIRPLPDGSTLVLTTADMLDRHGQDHPEGLVPDIVVEDGDDAVEAARAWLRSSADPRADGKVGRLRDTSGTSTSSVRTASGNAAPAASRWAAGWRSPCGWESGCFPTPAAARRGVPGERV